jgi:uncharacterized surface protein with fasciclin (FAS1) repeats
MRTPIFALALLSVAFVQPAHAGEHARKAAPASYASKTACANNGDVVDVAVQAGSFKTLAAALQAAGLVETL